MTKHRVVIVNMFVVSWGLFMLEVPQPSEVDGIAMSCGDEIDTSVDKENPTEPQHVPDG